MKSVRLGAELLAVALLLLLVLALPAVAIAETAPAPSTTPSAQQPVAATKSEPAEQGTTELIPAALKVTDALLLLAIALFFALLSMLKDFRSYRGLLGTLVWNFYSWVFLAFTATIIFGVDYAVLRVVLPMLRPNMLPESMLHVYLALGHTGVSAAFAYASPFLLGIIPSRTGIASPEGAHEKPEKPTTDLNVISAAIRESLENRVNGKISDWAGRYSWPVIRSTSRMLLVDLVNSGRMARQEGEAARKEMEVCQESTDFWQNRENKYELLRKIMKYGSFSDLRKRLEAAARADQAGAKP